MAQRRKPVRSVLKAAAIPVLGSICSSMLFVVGMTWRASKYESNLATVAMVERGFDETRKLILQSNEESRKFALEGDKLVTERLEAFSNHNHDDMMLRFSEDKAEWRAKLEISNARGEMILESVRRIEDRTKKNVNH